MLFHGVAAVEGDDGEEYVIEDFGRKFDYVDEFDEEVVEGAKEESD